MPKGKARLSSFIVPISSEELSYRVSVRSLRSMKKKDYPDVSVQDLRFYRNEIRGALKTYRGISKQRFKTDTQRKKDVDRLKKAAKHLIQARVNASSVDIGFQTAINEFCECFSDLDRSTRAQIYRCFLDPMIGAKNIQSISDRLFLLNHRTTWEETLNIIIDFKYTVTTYDSYANPALKHLVFLLAPIFKKITGRSLIPVIRNDNDSTRYDYCAHWIDNLIADSGCDPLEFGQIKELVKQFYDQKVQILEK